MSTKEYGPEKFPKQWSPSVIRLMNDTEKEVGDADIRGQWVFVRYWDGSTSYMPAHRIREIKRLETEFLHSREERRDGATHNHRLKTLTASEEDTEIIA